MALSTPALRRCQLTAAVARIVDLTTLVAVSAYLYSRSGAAAVAVFGVVRMAAPAVGTPLVTAAAGRWPPSRPLVSCTLVAAAGSAGTAVLVASDGPLVGIHALAGITGLSLLCLRPLVTALLPSLINRPAELVATNAAAAFIDGSSTLIGPLLAGAALATTGAPAALWLCAALLGAVGALVATLKEEAGRHAFAGPASRGWTRDVLAGLHTLFAGDPVRLIAVLSMGQTFVRGGLNVLVVVLAIGALDIGEGGVGLLLGAIGVGGLLGFPLAVRVARAGQMARAFALALVLWGLPIALVATTTTVGVALALFAIIGVGNAIVDITSDTLLQRLVPRAELARVLGAFDASLYAAMALGAVAAERLLSTFGLTTGLVAMGLVLPVLAALTWGWLHATDAQLRHRDADVALLQVHGIFSPMAMATVDHLVRYMDRESFAVGEVIIAKGDVGDRFYLIEAGAVEIVDDGERLAVLGPGDAFGEMALLHDLPRSATAIAGSPVQARSLRRRDFLMALTAHDRSHEVARKLADDRQAQKG